MAINLMGIPSYLNKAWDVVGIISGHGKVRIGKSTLAQQIGYYVAWMLAGGRMGKDEKTGKWGVVKKPKSKVTFSLDNLVFNPNELIKKADYLYKKYGKNQVIIYDEGRAGLDSARAMEQVNKVMQDFFQECGMYGHVILIVLPNFFKLHEDYAVNRSIFLIDVYHDSQLRRGYFNFYNDRQKEWLYFLGKKKIGSSLKYAGVNPSFHGRFTDFLPLDKTEYEEAKRNAIKVKGIKPKDIMFKKQRDALIFLLRKNAETNYGDISREVTRLSGEKLSMNAVKYAIENVTKMSLEDFEKEIEQEQLERQEFENGPAPTHITLKDIDEGQLIPNINEIPPVDFDMDNLPSVEEVEKMKREFALKPEDTPSVNV